MIGILLVSSATLIFLKSITLFNKQTVFYSEHFLANSLNEKVLETCFNESQLSPNGFESLGLVDKMGNSIDFSSEVTDGKTVFFKNPEINKTNSPILHNKLDNNFTVSIDCKASSDDFYEVSSDFNWSAKTGRGSVNTICRFLTFNGDKEIETNYSLDDALVEKRLLGNIFSTTSGNLGTIVGSFGAHELLMSMGHIYYPCYDLISSDQLAKRCDKIELLEGQAYSPDSPIYQKCSEEYFNLARDYFHLLLYIRTKFELMKSRMSFFNSISIQYHANVKGYINRSMHFTQQIQYLFISCISTLSARYEKQFDSAILIRDRKKILMRLFNLYRVLYACRDFSAPALTCTFSKTRIETQVNNFLMKIKKVFEKSDPAVSRLADYDIKLFNSKTLAQSYFIPKTVETLVKDVDEFLKVEY